MGKSAPKAPAAPDPTATANAQSAANLETAIGQGWLNAVNRYGPQGSVTYNQIGTQKVGDKDVPQFSETTTLSPEQQKQYDLQQELQAQALGLGKGVLGNVGNAVSQPFSLDGIPKAPGSGDFTADRDLATKSIIDRNTPQMDRQRAQLETQLMNQGVMPGSKAFQSRMDDLGRQENDFRLAAINAGGSEQSRLFGLGTQAHQQGISDLTLQRSQPINEYATLLGLGGQVQTPTANYQPPQLANTDVVGPMNTAYQGQLSQYGANNQARNSTMGGLFGLGGSALTAFGPSIWAASDIYLKEDIRLMGEENGFPIYHFRYKSDPTHTKYRGVMAQDVQKIMPEAVMDVGGYLAVDYGRIGVEMAAIQ